MGNTWQEVITPILWTILVAAASALAAVVIAFIRRLQEWVLAKLQSSLTAEQFAQAKSLAAVAVTYAEQIWQRPDIRALYDNKLALATRWLDEELKERGIAITGESIRALVESAVFSELQKAQVVNVQTGDVNVEAAPTPPTPTPAVQGVAIGTKPDSELNSEGGEGS